MSFADIRGRLARPAPVWWNLAKTLLQLVAFWAAFLWLLPRAVIAAEDALGLASLRFEAFALDRAGWYLFAFGSLLGLWSAGLMAIRGAGTPMPTDSTRRLVIVGPYRRVRNPMVLSGSSQALGVALMHGSFFLLAGVLLGMMVWNAVVRPWEEADLEARFGEPYRRYRDVVPCWRLSRASYRE